MEKNTKLGAALSVALSGATIAGCSTAPKEAEIDQVVTTANATAVHSKTGQRETIPAQNVNNKDECLEYGQTLANPQFDIELQCLNNDGKTVGEYNIKYTPPAEDEPSI